MKKFRVIDLFAGVGGLSYGFSINPNFEIVMANEYEKDIAKAYKLNHPTVDVIDCDIKEITADDLKKYIGNDGIDLIIGGPPCQSYSTLGKRQMDDRAHLFEEYCRILSIVKPKVFVYENVQGLLSMQKGKLIEIIKDRFRELGYDIKIKEKTDELLIKGDSVVKDYLNADIKLEDGYFNTGDLATIDADGYLYILDRRSDLIISGGENIYPKEIEDAVYMMADVNRCVVIKKDDEEWGSVPVLLLEDTVDETALLDHLSQQLAKYKMPREIHYVDKILMTSTGKISRSKNQKMFLEQ